MTAATYKVGDLIAWPAVPVDTLVREADGCFCIRRAGGGRMVWDPRARGMDSALGWDWLTATDQGNVTIVALHVAPLADLRQLVEVFEVREALLADGGFADLITIYRDVPGWSPKRGPAEAAMLLAERLHALGWRKDQPPEEALRLLREAS